MDILPILSTLFRHKTASLLIVLEIALSCAIISNTIFIIGSRVQQMQLGSGMVDDELVYLSSSSLLPDINYDAQRRSDVAMLAMLGGVRSVSSINQIPYGGNVWGSGIRLRPDQQSATVHASNYMDDGTLLPTFGLRVIEGRPFSADEYQDDSTLQASEGAVVPAVLLSAGLARKLFPGASAVGKDIYIWGDRPTRVVGVINDLMAPGEGGEFNDRFDTMILPIRVSNGGYALRTSPSQREAVLQAASDALTRNDPNRIIEQRSTVQQMRSAFHRRDRSVIWLLLGVSLALLAVTAFGIVGLSSFWVQQRTRQIGIRRALGATRRNILRYFQVENFLLSSAGIVLGTLLAYGLNLFLMNRYELPRLPLYYLPLAAALLWLLGQLAVLGPARRAAGVTPAVATRNI